MENLEILKKTFRNAKLIALSTMVQLLIFWYIANNGRQNASYAHQNSQNIEQMRMIFIILTIALFPAIKFIKSLFKKQKMPKIAKERNISKEVFFINKIFLANIIGLGASQPPAIWGMILTLNSKNINDFYMFAVLSVIVLIFNFPRYQVWEWELRKYIEADNRDMGSSPV